MTVKIRLARVGAKKKPFYRIVAADQRMKRDGRFLEKLGTYDSLSKQLNINREGIEKWLSVGAEASDPVTRLLVKEGFELKQTYGPKKEVVKKPKRNAAKKAVAPKAEVKAKKEEAPKAETKTEEAPKEESK